MRRPFMLWPLILGLLFIALGGFSGGIPMLRDPANGGYLQFAELLPQLPVSDFILPGLFLLVVMGVLPLLLSYALIARPAWRGVDRFFQWSRHYWAWTATAVAGFFILLFAMMPGVRRFYTE